MTEQPEGSVPPKQERLREIFRRMEEAPPSSSFDDAYELLCTTMDEVEDELTGLPNEPERWREIPRLFPPQMDRMSRIEGCEVYRFDSLRHVTYIAENGAIEIRSLRLAEGQLQIHFTKAGSDGRSACDVCPQLQTQNV